MGILIPDNQATLIVAPEVYTPLLTTIYSFLAPLIISLIEVLDTIICEEHGYKNSQACAKKLASSLQILCPSISVTGA